VALGLLAVAPFVDKTTSNRPADRKFAICIFTLFMMFWAILVIIGSFFRGEGFNFVFPWESGLFFDL
jgi:quinol-cytochrome oxidoreductase complex cytochrome b subunit